MKIRYRGYESGIMSDSPFIGVRVCAAGCHYNCPGCFNKLLKKGPIQEIEAVDLINQIKQEQLNQGVIFGGLEWSEQPQELRELVKLALANNLKVMIFTHWYINDFLNLFPEFKGKDILVKCGPYIEEMSPHYDSEFDVVLGSNNQYIKYLGNL